MSRRFKIDSSEKMIWKIKQEYGLDSSRVFSAMLQVSREKFVSKKYRYLAYTDGPIPIGHNQTMSQPYTVAFMTDLLSLSGDEKVLEIGTGSGYQAAVLSHLAREVFSLEIIRQLAERAKKRLKESGYKNVYIRIGSGKNGWPQKAPFDAILVTAGLEKKVPQALFDQLRVGGVLVAPIGRGFDKVMTKFTKEEKGKPKKEKYEIFHFVPFIEE